MKLGVTANFDKSLAPEVLLRLKDLAKEKGIYLYSTGKTAEFLGDCKTLDHAEFVKEIDVLMTLGGDGTLLKAVRALDGEDTPVIGVNLGKLGFMTSATEDTLDKALDCLAQGDYTISQRTMIESRCGHTDDVWTALNDVVLSWGPSARIANIQLSIDDVLVTTYTCDGLIISTPTGSTGHSLSAGGPIIHPDTPGFVVSVICPHTMSTRPVVIPDKSRIKITIAENSKELVLAVDGRASMTMSPGHELHIRKTETGARFIQLPGYNYFTVLRNKLNWRGSSIL
jgi:NAD+ kinase